jgi:hypothetical protein
MDYPLLSKIICLSASSPCELRCIDSVGSGFQMRFPLLLSKIMW